MRLIFVFLMLFSLPAFAVSDSEVFNIPESESDVGNPENSDKLEDALKDFTQPKAPEITASEEQKKINKDDAEKKGQNGIIVAHIQAINKVVGRVSNFEEIVGSVAHFENLDIIVHKCTTSISDDQPENSALLEIREDKSGEEPKQIFLGWMFSSSPSISALEHPVYDITIISCETRKNPEKTPEKLPEKSPEKNHDKRN